MASVVARRFRLIECRSPDFALCADPGQGVGAKRLILVVLPHGQLIVLGAAVGVGFVVDIAQAADGNVGVDLGRYKAGVAE